jgi:nucleotide-binding universal stress UspA family protein
MSRRAELEPLRIRSILLPLDGSPFAEHAVPWATALARAARARLRLILVHQPPEPPPADRSSRGLYTRISLALRKSEREYLRTAATRIKAEGLTQVTSATLQGAPGPTLAQYAGELGVDLVVMTTHGRGGLERAWLGSVADHLVRALEIPLLLVRPGEGVAASPRAEEILVALDGSRRAEAALPPAMSVATLLGGRITLLQSVAPVPMMWESPAPFPASYSDELSAMRRAQAKDYLEDMAAEVRAAGIEARPTAVLAANPVEAIQAAARAPDVGLIALATHGRSGLRRMVIGSVADKLVRSSEVPVLVTRPRGR